MMQLAVGDSVIPGKFTRPTVKVNVSLVMSPVALPLKTHSTIPLRTVRPPIARFGGKVWLECTAITEMAMNYSEGAFTPTAYSAVRSLAAET
jgi:hypothetical protein